MNEEKNITTKDSQQEALQTQEDSMTENTYVPQVDIVEKAEGIEILADMPGVSKENVDAVIEEGVLTIKGRVTPPYEEDLSDERREYDYGNFYRSFAIGDGLDAENIGAAMKDGVLTLTIPKSEKFKPKKIDIQ